MDKMREIVDKLNTWAYQYYTLDNPSVPDATYDALYDRLVTMEREYNTVLPDSPTRRVGGQVLQKFLPYTHKRRLYSLDKAQSKQELSAWIDKVQQSYPDCTFSVELKYDGLSMSVTYNNGELISAATRGNGQVGEQVTAQALCIKSLPLVIDFKGEISVQGEAIMRLSALDNYNKKHPENPLKNARNGAAGAIRNLDPKICAERNLDCVMYAVGQSEMDFASQGDLVKFLRENRFKTNYLYSETNSKDEIFSTIDKVDEQRSKYDFLIDGVVIKVTDFAVREQLGYTDKFPRWAIAYKFMAEQAVTTLLAVDWQVGRTGKLTPLAILESVELCGATISRATLNNYDDIVRKNLRLGDTVLIRRSNDVIPEVLYSIEDNSTGARITPPEHCPVCGAPTAFSGAHLFCPNKRECEAQIINRLTHYASKNACDIEGLSVKTITQMSTRLGVKGFFDLYTVVAEDLARLDGFKQTKINNVLTSIEQSKAVALPNFIFALGIGNIGIVTARELAKKYGSIDALASADRDSLVSIDEVGEIVAESIQEYFADEFNAEQIRLLRSIGINPVYQQKTQAQGVFLGKSVVLTGTLSAMSRDSASRFVEQLGGTVLSAVTKSCNLVIVGQNAGSKLDKAKALGVEIIEEDAFIKILKENGVNV